MSQSHLKRRELQERQSRLELKIPPVALVLIVGVLMFAASSAAPTFDYVLPAKLLWTLSLALAGGLTCLAGVVSFRRAKTTVNPMKLSSTSKLVTSGIYQHTRNPMYLGFVLVLLGGPPACQIWQHLPCSRRL